MWERDVVNRSIDQERRQHQGVQTELISGDQNRNIRVWDLTANSCSCELVDTSMRSLTVMWDGSLVVAVNNKGTCYVWRLLRGTRGTNDGYGIGCFL
uniref:Target of rapamycin complex subunit LST8 n=1 Tax=Lactuca sativa TaxID=4236 RepID=A0A9R1XKE2_LACSA|nr:hypothetical protein LSAT_V11C300151090 [Lactuca sativa]